MNCTLFDQSNHWNFCTVMIKQVIANAQNVMMELEISSMADSDNDINKNAPQIYTKWSFTRLLRFICLGLSPKYQFNDCNHSMTHGMSNSCLLFRPLLSRVTFCIFALYYCLNSRDVTDSFQRRIQTPVENLRRSFFAKIVNDLKPSRTIMMKLVAVIFVKKLYHRCSTGF